MDPLGRFAQTLAGPSSLPSLPEFSAPSAAVMSYSQAGQNAGQTDALLGQQKYNTGVTVANQQAAEEAAKSQRISELKIRQQQLQDAVEGKNYQQIKKADGGYDFLDPLGNRISIHRYALATGANEADILKKSDNTLDRQFVSDYKNFQGLMDALINKDKTTLDEYYKVHPELKGVSAGDLGKYFMSYYPNIYKDDTYASQRGQVGNLAIPR